MLSAPSLGAKYAFSPTTGQQCSKDKKESTHMPNNIAPSM